MSKTKLQTPFLNIPGWGMDRVDYEVACRYLGLSPDAALHDKVARYLLLATSSRPTPTGFGRWLAELQPGRFNLVFIDTWTRMLMPSHPWRFRLNAIVAVHECDPQGLREMMAPPASGSAPGCQGGHRSQGVGHEPSEQRHVHDHPG